MLITMNEEQHKNGIERIRELKLKKRENLIKIAPRVQRTINIATSAIITFAKQ